MILGFMQYFDKKRTIPTYFREKILAGTGICAVVGTTLIDSITLQRMNTNLIQLKPKLHTMREDKHDRWRAGMSIQMVYRGPKYSIKDQFNKDIQELSTCVSTQSIILYFSEYAGDSKLVSIYIDSRLYWVGQVTKTAANSCSPEDRQLIEQLAMNDGFESSIDFFRWFKKEWSGKLIHWTDLKY